MAELACGGIVRNCQCGLVTMQETAVEYKRIRMGMQVQELFRSDQPEEGE